MKFALRYFPSNFQQQRSAGKAVESESLSIIVKKFCSWMKRDVAELEKENNVLSVLDTRLAEFSYLNGYQISDSDFKVFSALELCDNNNSKSFPHLSRWRKHITYHQSRNGHSPKVREGTSSARVFDFAHAKAFSNRVCVPAHRKLAR